MEHAAIMTLNSHNCVHIPLCSLEIRVGQENVVLSPLESSKAAQWLGTLVPAPASVSAGSRNLDYGFTPQGARGGFQMAAVTQDPGP